MSSLSARRCQHIKVNGTQCGSPALRNQNFCFYHQQNRPLTVDWYYNPEEYATGEITLPLFEDAHSIQTVIRQVVQMVLQKRLERKTASLMLYALQIASSNLKRIELEKPQPEQVVIDLVTESKWATPIAAPTAAETVREISASEQFERNAPPVNASTKTGEDKDRDKDKDKKNELRDEGLPPGTIRACHRPYDRLRPLHREQEDATIQ